MAVKIAPSPRQQFVDANGVPYSGAKLFTYAAGSSTKQTTYTDSTGSTANSNPIILDSAGRTPYGRWYTSGLSYKEVLAPSTDTDPPTSPIFTEDNLNGVNDTSVSASQWGPSGFTPTYISTTQFSVIGDQTSEFHVNRRLKLTASAGTLYGKILTSAYTTLTTITVVLDSGALDSGLSSVDLSILTAINSSIPKGVLAGNVVQVDQAETSVASATSITLATTLNQLLTGTTTVATINSVVGRTNRIRVETGTFSLTHSAGLNCLQTGATIITRPGDTFDWFALTASTGIVMNYTRADGTALVAITNETGTYTPTVTGATVVGTPTYAGTYTKIGRQVRVVATFISTTSFATSSRTSAYFSVPFAKLTGSGGNGVATFNNFGTNADLGQNTFDLTGCYFPQISAQTDIMADLSYFANA